MDALPTHTVAAIDPVAAISAVMAGIAAILGSWAVVQSRKTEGRSLAREETQQAIDAQTGLLNRYETAIADRDKKIEALEAKVDALEARVEDALGARAAAESGKRDCEIRCDALEARVIAAEARIAAQKDDESNGR